MSKFVSYDLLHKAGGLFIDDALQHTGPFSAIQGVSSAIVDVSDCTANIDELADFTIPDGTIIYGTWDVFSLTSGTAIAYYAQ